MPEEKPQKRQIAFKVKISDILSGVYVKEEGWTPNYIKTAAGKISRANIIGTVIAVEEDINFKSIVIDDGSGKLQARTFEKQNIFDSFEVGDIAYIIGRPREYNSQRYILVEVIKKIKNPLWLKLRSLELKKTLVPEKEEKHEDAKEEIITETIADYSYDAVLEFIRNNDKGEGVPHEEIISMAKDEKIIDSLLKNGEIFEIKPGRFKVL